MSASRGNRSAIGVLIGLLLGAASAGGVAFAGPTPFTAPAPEQEEAHARPEGAGAVVGTSETGSPVPTSGELSDVSTPTSSSSTAATTTTTEPPATTTTAQPPVATDAGQEQQVLTLVNAARANGGCSALRVDARITAAAQAHSEDMASNNYFEHDSLDGRDFGDRVLAAGYPSPSAENIAKGARSAEQVVRMWMDSPGHRRNILDCTSTAMGLGLDTRGWYWTQDFGR